MCKDSKGSHRTALMLAVVVKTNEPRHTIPTNLIVRKANIQISPQADQSLRCPLEGALDPWLPTELPAKTLIGLHRWTRMHSNVMANFRVYADIDESDQPAHSHTSSDWDLY